MCQRERASQALVVHEVSTDARRKHSKCVDASVIFSSNDAQHHTNKTGAEEFAGCRETSMVWSQANTKATSEVLQQCAGQVVNDIDWAQRHAQDIAHLYCLFLLVHDVPVLLTEHVNRNPRVNRLPGRVALIRVWTVDPAVASVHSGKSRM